MSDLTLTKNETETAAETVTRLECAQMNQLPGEGPRGESPLYHADLASMANKGPVEGGVQLQELALLGHLVLRGSLQNKSIWLTFMILFDHYSR